MGINDRDYYRQVHRGSFRAGAMTNVWQKLIIANVIVFVIQMAVRGSTGYLDLDPESVLFGGQVWRLITYAFCHDPHSIWHILFNMLWLWAFGPELESLYGSREFLIFYLTSAVVAGLAHLSLCLALDSGTAAVGASGAVMGLAMLYALYYPTREFIIYIFPIQARWLVTLFVIMDLFPVLGALGGEGGTDGVAHAAHLGGLAYGFLYKKFDLRYDRLFGGWNFFRLFRDMNRKRSVRLYHPAEPAEPIQNLNERVDEILAKISDRGEASLTDREREILKEASRRFKEK